MGELESALLDPDAVGGELGRLARGYRAELDRLGLWDRDGLRRRAAERIQSDLAAWGAGARLRLRLRGPDRRGVGADRSARRADGRDRLDPVRAGATGLRRARGNGQRPGSAGCGSGRGAAARRASSRASAAGSSRARALRRRAASRGIARGLGAVPRGSGSSWEPSSSSPRELLGLVRADTPPDRIGIVCESPERWRATFESVLGAARHSLCDSSTRCGSARRPSAARCSRCSATPGVAASRAELFTFLALALLGPRAPLGRLRRRAPARSRDRGSGPGRGGEREAARRARPRTRRAARRGGSGHAPLARLLKTMIRNAWGLDAPPVGDDARGDARAYRADGAHLRRARRSSRSWTGGESLRTMSSPRSSGPQCGRSRPGKAGAWPSSTTAEHARGSSTWSSCSVSRRGACRGATGPRRCWTTTLAESSAAGSSGRTRSLATATSSTPPALARPVGLFWFARPRATRAFRASRARSGTTFARSTRPPRSPAPLVGARCPALPGRWTRRRATASACARWRA